MRTNDGGEGKSRRMIEMVNDEGLERHPFLDEQGFEGALNDKNLQADAAPMRCYLAEQDMDQERKRTVAGIEFDVKRQWSDLLQRWGEHVVPKEMNCPQCGCAARVSVGYFFYKDSLVFKCPHCRVFEWQGNKI